MAFRKKFLFDALIFCLTLSPVPTYAEEVPAQVYFAHALKSKEEGRLLTAQRLLRKAIEMTPENPDYHFELGNLSIEQGDLTAARQELEQAVMINPDHLAAHYNLGLVYRELGAMSEAREEFRRVLDQDPFNAKAQLQIGYTYQKEGFVEDARQAFKEAREMDFNNPEPRLALQELDDFETHDSLRSRAELQRSLWQNHELLQRLRAHSQDESDTRSS